MRPDRQRRPQKLRPVGEGHAVGTSENRSSPSPLLSNFRIGTPMSDTASHFGDLMFSAGVLPQPTANTPALLVHPSSLISTWTRNENLSKLGSYLLDNDSRSHTRDATPSHIVPNAYITEAKHAPTRKGGLPPMPQTSLAPNKLPPLASSADVLSALQVLQDSMKAMQSHAVLHHAHADTPSASSPRDDTTHSKDIDESNMTRVDLWKYKHSLLPAGVQSPTFSNADMVRYVPSKYIQRKIYDIRLDPQKWFELKETVSALQETDERRASRGVIERNRRLAASVSPTRRREICAEKKNALRDRIQDAKQRRDAVEETRLQTIMTHDERQRARHREQALHLVVMTALGARLGMMVGAFTRVRNKRLHGEQTRAAMTIQRAVRKHVLGHIQLTPVQAFIMRSRIVRRFCTKVKAKVLVPKYTDMIHRFIGSIRFENRILLAFRKIHDRVVTAQRLVRRWQSEKQFMGMIRSLQWDRCVAKRIRDFSVMAAKGSSLERDLAMRELEDLRSITPEAKLRVLDKFRTETRQVFLEAMRVHADGRKEAENAEDARTAAILRKRIPKKPHIRILIAAEQIERMVRNAARQTRLERTMNASQFSA